MEKDILSVETLDPELKPDEMLDPDGMAEVASGGVGSCPGSDAVASTSETVHFIGMEDLSEAELEVSLGSEEMWNRSFQIRLD